MINKKISSWRFLLHPDLKEPSNINMYIVCPSDFQECIGKCIFFIPLTYQVSGMGRGRRGESPILYRTSVEVYIIGPDHIIKMAAMPMHITKTCPCNKQIFLSFKN